jgi:3'(2'), 5'-bisphosphate nucleotidase
MTAQNYERERAAARAMALEAATVVKGWHERGVKVEWKGEDDPVTSADREANDLIIRRIHETFPDDAVLSEESRDDLSRLEAERVWIVDPLDGTKDFITGTGDFAVMVGLAVGGRPVVGAVCRPLDGTLWHASLGQGALCESPSSAPRALTVSEVAEPAQMALVVTRTHRFPLLEKLVQSLGITREKPLGSVGLKVGALSSAEADLYVHLSLGIKEWDTCAPEVILTEAGGLMTDTFGQPLPYNGRDVMRRHGVVASNNRAHQHVIDVIAPLAREAFPD